MTSTNEELSYRNESFLTTNWSVVLCARDQNSPESNLALAELCQSYWYPLFAYARRQGYSTEQAQDWTQGFFEALLEKHFLDNIDRRLGRFRAFLLASFKHFIAKQRRANQAQKRGGGRRVLSIDFSQAEQRYAQQEPSHEQTAEQLFERQWALTLLDRVLTLLEEEQTRAGKKQQHDRLKVFLDGSDGPSYREVGEELQMSEGAVKVAVHRLRQRFGELLRQVIERTIADADAVDDEIQGLLATLRT